MGWNCNGWGREKAEDKSLVIIRSNAHIVMLCETWRLAGQIIDIPRYKYLGNNRALISNRADVGSGGVAILLSDIFLNEYCVDRVDSSYDGILAVQVKSLLSDECLAFICVYIPPDSSKRGREESEMIFEHLTQLLF